MWNLTLERFRPNSGPRFRWSVQGDPHQPFRYRARHADEPGRLRTPLTPVLQLLHLVRRLVHLLRQSSPWIALLSGRARHILLRVSLRQVRPPALLSAAALLCILFAITTLHLDASG